METYKVEVAKKYYQLCDERDELYRQLEPIQKRLDEANAKVSAAQLEVAKVVAEYDKVQGDGQAFLAMKSEISSLAKMFKESDGKIRIPPRESVGM